MCSLLISLVAFYANTSHFPFDNDDGRLLQYQHHVSVTLTLLMMMSQAWPFHRHPMNIKCPNNHHTEDIFSMEDCPILCTIWPNEIAIVWLTRGKLASLFRSLSDKQLFWGNPPRNAFSSSKSKPWFGWGFWFWWENISKMTKIGNFMFSWSFHKIYFSLWPIVKHLNWSNFRWETFWTFEEEEVAATVKLLHGV